MPDAAYPPPPRIIQLRQLLADFRKPRSCGGPCAFQLQELELAVALVDRLIEKYPILRRGASVVCPECGGNVGDHEDSSKDCFECQGVGRVWEYWPLQ